MNLLLLNLAVDDHHTALAFGSRWIEALTKRFDHIDVVTMTAWERRLPDDVRVWTLGRERGYSEARRALRFYRIIGTILCDRRIDVVFTHMNPLFAVMLWPIAKVAGWRNVLWYAHGATPCMLRIAHHLVDRIVSSTSEGFRLKSEKVEFIGQGIEIDVFKPQPKAIDQVRERMIPTGRRRHASSPMRWRSGPSCRMRP